MLSFVNKRAGRTDDQRTIEQLMAYLPNGEYVISVVSKQQWQKQQRRTSDQNALMWAYFSDIAKLFNNYSGSDYWDSTLVHDYFCSMWGSVERSPIGIGWSKPLKTSQMNKTQMSDFLQKVQAHLASEFGMNVPLPNDDDYAQFHEQINMA